MKPFPSRAIWALGGVATAAFFVLLWKLVTEFKLVSPIFLPAPDRVWASLTSGLSGGDLVKQSSATILRMFQGWLLASFIGIAVGSIVGSSKAARIYLEPTLEIMRPLPPSALFPVAIVLLGMSDVMVTSVIAFGSLWPVLLATIHGFSTVEPRLYEVGRALGLSRWATIKKISLPNAVPDIVAALRVSLTAALILSVVGEMLSGSQGLGSWILIAGRRFRSPDLFAGVVILGVIGFLSSKLLAAGEAYFLRWRNPLAA